MTEQANPEGLLCVFSEPGELVSLEEFQDWYNDEHVPLRVNHFLSFLTGARYFSLDEGKKPSWVAVYDISELAALQDERYTRLRTNRSEREAGLVKRLEILDRRICRVVWDSGLAGSKENATTSFGAGNPTRYLVSLEVDVEGAGEDDAVIQRWLEHEAGVIRLEQEGWLRTRAFRCDDVVRSGVGVGTNAQEQIVPKYLVLHEYSTVPQNSTLLGDTVKVVEQRRWELYRAYPTIAQGNQS